MLPLEQLDGNKIQNVTIMGNPSRLKRFAVNLNLPGVCLAITSLLLFLLLLTHPPGALDAWPMLGMYYDSVVSTIDWARETYSRYHKKNMVSVMVDCSEELKLLGHNALGSRDWDVVISGWRLG